MFGQRHLFPPFPSSNALSKLQLKRVAVQVIVTGTLTNVLFDAPTIIDASAYSYNPVNGFITFLKTGYYQFSFDSSWAVSGVGTRWSFVNIVDGTTRDYAVSGITTINTAGQYCVSPLIRINNVGATSRCRVVQNTGANLNLGGTDNLECNIIRLDNL